MPHGSWLLNVKEKFWLGLAVSILVFFLIPKKKGKRFPLQVLLLFSQALGNDAGMITARRGLERVPFKGNSNPSRKENHKK